MGRRGGYSGSSTFTFTVQRLKDKVTGEYYRELLTLQMVEQFWTIELI